MASYAGRSTVQLTFTSTVVSQLVKHQPLQAAVHVEVSFNLRSKTCIREPGIRNEMEALTFMLGTNPFLIL